MSINSIEIKERTWNAEKENYEISYETITRDEYSGDFEDLILENINRSDLESYAENELGMIDEDDCDCHSSIHDHADYELISYLEDQGYKVVKCQTINDESKFEQLKQIMELH